MVAGTFHVPSAIQKPLVLVATAHGVSLLLRSVPATFRQTPMHALRSSGPASQFDSEIGV